MVFMKILSIIAGLLFFGIVVLVVIFRKKKKDIDDIYPHF